MLHNEPLSSTHLNTATKLWWDWVICNVICRGCSMMNYCLELILILQQKSFESHWFVIWFEENVRWWNIVSNSPLYMNRPLMSLIDSYCDSQRMFDDETSSLIHLNTWTEFLWAWLIGNEIWRGGSMMKHCLQLISILQQNSYQTHCFVT